MAATESPAPEYGPWVMAHYPGICIRCGAMIEPGDYIRADRDEQGWLCGLCGDRGGGIQEIRVQGRYL